MLWSSSSLFDAFAWLCFVWMLAWAFTNWQDPLAVVRDDSRDGVAVSGGSGLPTLPRSLSNWRHVLVVGTHCCVDVYVTFLSSSSSFATCYEYCCRWLHRCWSVVGSCLRLSTAKHDVSCVPWSLSLINCAVKEGSLPCHNTKRKSMQRPSPFF